MNTAKPKIKITGHSSREEYHKEYNRQYRLLNKEYFRKYKEENREKFRLNSHKYFLKLKNGAFWFTFKDDIKELENALRELKAKNRQLLKAINLKLSQQNK